MNSKHERLFYFIPHSASPKPFISSANSESPPCLILEHYQLVLSIHIDTAEQHKPFSFRLGLEIWISNPVEYLH
jgi:hypothetical protein